MLVGSVKPSLRIDFKRASSNPKCAKDTTGLGGSNPDTLQHVETKRKGKRKRHVHKKEGITVVHN